VRSVSLTGKRRFSDADVERARLLHQYALHRASADAERLADLQYARAALVEAQDALFQMSDACGGKAESEHFHPASAARDSAIICSHVILRHHDLAPPNVIGT
jgi:hypothetical protein